MRNQFRLTDTIIYMDTASISLRPISAVAAGQAALEASSTPWRLAPGDKSAQAGEIRGLAAEMIGAQDRDIAIVNSVSYGMATAAANLPIAPGDHILIAEGEHPSSFLLWQHIAGKCGASLKIVSCAADEDWTRKFEEALQEVPSVRLAILSPVHWADGRSLDLSKIAAMVRKQAGALIIDATQAAGVIDIDAVALDADFIMFPAYKWLLGPYGLAFLYANPRHHGGETLEHHMSTRKAPALQRSGVAGDFSHLDGAVRFDKGERDDRVMLSVAAEGLMLAASVTPAEKRTYLWTLNALLTERLAQMPVRVAPSQARAPHILSIDLGSHDAPTVVAALARRSVFVSARKGFLRVSLYMHNTQADIIAFADALADVLSSGT